MKDIVTALRRYLLLNKRILKRASFILILAAVPVMVAAIGVISEQQNGVVNIALAAEDQNDRTASEIIETLAADGSGIERFIVCETVGEAENAVVYGKADGAWILCADLDERIAGFVSDLQSGNACVRVIEREETIALELAREKLSGVLSPYISRALMLDFSRSNVPALGDMSDEELDFYFDDAFATDDIFEFSYLDSGEPTDDVSLDIIVLPMRGFLSVTVVLAGLAVGLYYMRDEEAGSFYRLKRSERPAFVYAYQLTGIIDVALVVLAALFISGIATTPLREIAAAAIFCFASASFCILVRRICGKAGRLAAVTPLLTVALIAVSPIFFNIAGLRGIQLATPTYYYLRSIHQPVYLGYMAIYAAVVGLIDYVIYKLTDRA